MEPAFAVFLDPAAKWTKYTSNNPNRDLTDNDESVPEAKRLTATQKVANLNRMLGLVAQYSPSLLRNDLIKKSTSLNYIWQRIRKYYSFQQSEAQFLKFSTITLEPGERYEHLYQRIIAFLEDNLMTTESGLLFEGSILAYDEDMSPTVERLAVLRWLELVCQPS